MKVTLIIFFSIGISCFFLAEIFPSYEDLFFTSLVSLYGMNNNLLSKLMDVQEILQHVNAVNDTDDDNNIDTVTSREGLARNIPVGLWTPINSSYVLQHLNGAEMRTNCTENSRIIIIRQLKTIASFSNNFTQRGIMYMTDPWE